MGMISALKISKGCSECYAVAGDASAKNCPLQCMKGWCTSGCLSCSAKEAATASTCSGIPTTKVPPCSSDGPEGNDVSDRATVVAGASQDVTVSAGACTAEDKSKIAGLPAGSAKGSFGDHSNTCGHAAYSIFTGFDHDKFDACMTSALKISKGCSECYAVAGD